MPKDKNPAITDAYDLNRLKAPKTSALLRSKALQSCTIIGRSLLAN